MLKFRKLFNSKIVLLTIGISFLFTNTPPYAHPDLKDTLRIPVGIDKERSQFALYWAFYDEKIDKENSPLSKEAALRYLNDKRSGTILVLHKDSMKTELLPKERVNTSQIEEEQLEILKLKKGERFKGRRYVLVITEKAAGELKQKSLNGIREAYFEHYGSRGHRRISPQRMVDERFPDVYVRSADYEEFYPELRRHVATQGSYIPASRLDCTVQPSHRYGDRSLSMGSLLHLQLFEMAAAWYVGEEVDPERIFRDILDFLETCGLERSKLQITVRKKGEIEANPHLAEFDVKNAWLRAGISPEQISPMAPGEKVWSQGGVGITDLGGPGKRGWLTGDNTEVWYEGLELCNILFPSWIKTSKDGEGGRIPLGFPMCEAVIGLDRLAKAVEGSESIFDIDSVAPLCAAIRESVPPEAVDNLSSEAELERLVHIVADDLRALAFLVADGATLVMNSRKRTERDNILYSFTNELLKAMRTLQIDHKTQLRYLLEVTTVPYANVYPEIADSINFDKCEQFLEQRLAPPAEMTVVRALVGRKGTPGILRRFRDEDPDLTLNNDDYYELERFGIPKSNLERALEFIRLCVKQAGEGDLVIYADEFQTLVDLLGADRQELKSVMRKELGARLTRDRELETAKLFLTIDQRNLQKTTVFFIGDQVKQHPEQFQEALSPEHLGTRNRPIVLVEREDEIDGMTMFIYVDLRIDTDHFEVRTFEDVELDPNRINQYLHNIVGIDNFQCIPLTDSLCGTYDDLRKARDKVTKG